MNRFFLSHAMVMVFSSAGADAVKRKVPTYFWRVVLGVGSGIAGVWFVGCEGLGWGRSWCHWWRWRWRLVVLWGGGEVVGEEFCGWVRELRSDLC
jgi:hypothetical protein